MQPALPSDADLLLSHIAGVRKLDAREFATEREVARNEFQRDRSDFNRVKYALMLALVPPATSSIAATVAHDDAELISIIEPLLATAAPGSAAADSQVRTLATLLNAMVSERRRVREQLRDTQIRLALARKDDTREAEARALRARVEELESRLNALKSIDRSVNRRAESARK